MSKIPSDITPSQAPRTNGEPMPHASNANPLSDNARIQLERSITAAEHHKPIDKSISLKKQQLLSLIEVSKPKSAAHGDFYNTYLAITIILHQFKKSTNYRHETKTIKTSKQKNDFIVAVEVGEADKFDDILFYFSSPKGLFTFWIQAKHKLNPTKKACIKKTADSNDFIKKKDLCATSGNFSIPMYFKSYLQFNQKLTKGEPNTRNDEYITRYVICTNDDLQTDVKRYFKPIKPEEDDSLQFCEAIGATCYKLHGEIPDLNEQLKKVYKQEFNTDSEFNKKKDEFFSKFLLICKSKNQEHLRLKAMTLLPEWCDKAQHEIIINDLVGLLKNSLYSKPRYGVELERLQKWFLENHLNQNIIGLMRLSEEHLEAVLEKHRNIEVKPESLEKLKLFLFLKDSGCGIYEFNSTLDLTVSSRILLQALSLLTYETIFIDSTKYAKQQDMNDILKALLLYLRDVNHPTIKVVTILGNPDRISINEMKESLGKYRQKIVVIGYIAGSLQNEDIPDRIVVNDLSDKASTHFYTQAERPIFGSTTALSSIVKKSDNLTFLLNVLDPCDQLRKIIDQNLNEMNYKSIKHWYVPRHIVPHEQSDVKAVDTYGILPKMTEDKCIPPDFQDTGRGKVFILLNDAGFGKSSYFTSLAYCLSTFDPSLYIIKFIAMEFSTDFEWLIANNVENLDDTHIVRLLYRYIHLALFVPSMNKRDIKKTDTIREEAVRCADLLTVSSGKIVLDESKTNMLSMEKLIELRLFQEKFNHQKIIIILDGFDETAPLYNGAVLKCFARFSHLEGIKSLFLSSRPYGLREDLKKTFEQCQMYGLKPFSDDELMSSIHKFLNNKLDGYELCKKEHLIDIGSELFHIFKYGLNDIIGIPLLLYMVQIILLPEIEKRVDAFTHTTSKKMLDEIKFDILYLVEEFVGRKMKILFTAKEAKKFEDQNKKEIKEQHILLAMYVLFDKNDLQQLLSEEERKRANEIMEEVNQGDEKTGIVLGVQNGVPQFLHRTFAEYFTACWLFENRKRFKDGTEQNRESIFHSQTIWSNSLWKTREFFDRLILRESKDCHLHLALVNRSRTQVEKILHNNSLAVTIPDMVGRLPLHFAEYLNDFPNSIIEKIICKENNKTDQLCGWTALDYAFVLDKKEIIKLLFKSDVKPNMHNLFQQVRSNSMNVLLEMACKYTNTCVELLKRMDLAEELNKRVAKLLIEEKKLDIYTARAELNSLSVFDKVISGRSVYMYHQLVQLSKKSGA